jgi:hypothetical protein
MKHERLAWRLLGIIRLCTGTCTVLRHKPDYGILGDRSAPASRHGTVEPLEEPMEAQGWLTITLRLFSAFWLFWPG